MSENTNDLNDSVQVTVSDADVITVPIDDTLSNSGEAADAKAVGDALALKADKSELQTAISVNGQSADNQGVIIVTADDTKMSGTDNTTVKAAIEAVDGKTAATIKMSSDQGAQTIAAAISDAGSRTGADIQMGTSDTRKVKNVVDSLSDGLTALSATVSGLDSKTGASIPYQSGSAETIKQHVDAIDQGLVKSVNSVTPDEHGDIALNRVPYADNLYSDEMEQVDDDFIERMTGGSLGISGSNAWLLRIMGNRVHTNFTPESLEMTVTPMPRTTPPAITAVLNEATFEAYVEEAGTYILEYTNNAWDANPSNYGVTISNDPVNGDKITIVWDGENDAVLTVSAVERTAPPAITATIDRDTWVTEVTTSGTTTFAFTTVWTTGGSEVDLDDYGITVTNVPIAGDQISVVYVKEVRGTITNATPTSITATGWNLYNHTAGYARVLKYSNLYGYKIGGTYTSIAWVATSTEQNPTPITPDENGLFMITNDGYIFVTGGNNSSTYILPTWSDWENGYEGDWEGYTTSTVTISTIMSNYFPYGLLRVGDTRDEIDFGMKQAISRISRIAYSAENRASAEASGRDYEFDENYIYIVRDTPTVNSITVSEEYICDDHGMEFFSGTSVAVYTEILYGQNLKDKLRRDVVTVRAQTFTSGQQAQARTNIGLGDAATKTVANNLTTTTEGSVLDARQGASLNQAIANLSDKIKRVPIENNSDFDSYTGDLQGNKYYCGYGIGTISHRPSGETNVNFPFELDVSSITSYTIQTLRVYTANATPKVYMRQQYYQDAQNPKVWGDWQAIALKSDIAKSGTVSGTTSASGNIAVSGKLLGKSIYCCGCIAYDSSDNILQDAICVPTQFSATGVGVVLGFNVRSSASPYNPIANTSVKIRYMYYEKEIT